MEATKTESLRGSSTTFRAEAESPEVTALVERAKGGDADAFGDLMHLYERRSRLRPFTFDFYVGNVRLKIAVR